MPDPPAPPAPLTPSRCGGCGAELSPGLLACPGCQRLVHADVLDHLARDAEAVTVHEIGHVAALQRLGIRATAPMFVPGLGAFVRLEQYPADAHEDARVGLAGPVWGLGAALVAFAAWRATGAAYWGAIAHAAAWLNLFNLLPVWQLDGSRGVRTLSRPQRWLVVAAMAGAFWLTGEGLLVLLLLAAGWRALGSEAGPGDRRALVELVGLVAVLSALCAIELPGLASP